MKLYRNLKNTNYSSFDLSIDHLFKQGESVYPCGIHRDSEGLQVFNPLADIVENTTMQTNLQSGVEACTAFLNNSSTERQYVFFVSFNYHTEININDRGKPKPLNRCTQKTLYNHFRNILMNKLEIPFNLEFCYTFFEQNIQGKIHFHQLIYLRDASPWSYNAALLNALNPHKRDKKACVIRPFNGDSELLLSYMFSKKDKDYEIINQDVFKPLIYLNIEQ